MIVCVCNGVSERDVRAAIDAGCASIEELSQRTGCGTTCGCCREMARDLLAEGPTNGFALPLLRAA